MQCKHFACRLFHIRILCKQCSERGFTTCIYKQKAQEETRDLHVMAAVIVTTNIIVMENRNSKDDRSNDVFPDIVDFDLYDVGCA